MTFSKTKDPDAVLDYSVDWAAWLGADTIATSTWIVTGPDADLVVDSDSNSTTATTVWLSGGTVFRTYTVTNRITTAQARTDDRSVVISMVDR